MQHCLEIYIFSHVRKSQLNWIGHGSRMDSKREVSQGFKNNPQGSQLRGWQKSI